MAGPCAIRAEPDKSALCVMCRVPEIKPVYTRIMKRGGMLAGLCHPEY